MKLRVYYDGYKDRYIIEHKWFGLMWRSYVTFRSCYDGLTEEYYIFKSEQDAIEFVNAKRNEVEEERKIEALAKERSKKSKVIYEIEF